MKNKDLTIEDALPDKVSLDILKKIWNDDQHSYTDEELKKIREWLYVIAKVTISVCKRIEKEQFEQQTKIITLQTTPYEKAQSDTLHQSEYRRAS